MFPEREMDFRYNLRSSKKNSNVINTTEKITTTWIEIGKWHFINFIILTQIEYKFNFSSTLSSNYSIDLGWQLLHGEDSDLSWKPRE